MAFQAYTPDMPVTNSIPSSGSGSGSGFQAYDANASAPVAPPAPVTPPTPNFNFGSGAGSPEDLKTGFKDFAGYSNSVLNGMAQPLANSMTDVNKNVQESESGAKNPLSAGIDVAGNIAKGVVGMFGGALNNGIVKPLSDLLSNTPGMDTIATSKYSVVPAMLDQMDGANKAMATAWNTFATAHPTVADKLGDAGNIAQFMLLFAGDNPKAQEAAQTVADTVKEGAANAVDTASNAVEMAKNAVGDVAGNLKEKIAPTEPIETTIGKVAQGKTTDIPSLRSALTDSVSDPTGKVISEPLDTSNVKTYQDLSTSAQSKISDIVAKQDEILSKDPTPHPMTDFEKTVGSGDNAVKVNYVKQALDGLQELYTKTNDAKGLSDIKALATKANDVGLTTKEVNDLARNYGSEFGSKAFGKSGEALTSVNATSLENTRTGLKNTARDLLPDETSKALDSQMTNLYDTKALSDKMVEKVNTAIQRLQSKNILQKLGGFIGKVGKYTGIGDIGKELPGLSNTPGASSMNAVDIEAGLAKNLARITKVLGSNDAGFVSGIKDMLNHPK